MKIGAQFFTIREFCKTTDDFAESLKKVADIGYKTVQISGTCPYEGPWLKEQLDKTGLACVITHNPLSELVGTPVTLARKHDTFGCKYIGLGSFQLYAEEGNPDQTIEAFQRIYGPVAKILKENGKYFMYHNHSREFMKVNGRHIMDMLAEAIPADEMGFTLDTYWAQFAGADPAAWIEKFSGRVPCIHLKDITFDQKMAPVGEGNINFDRVFEKAEAAGTEYMLVEQDRCYDENPFDCLKRSYDYLTACGFE